MEYQSANAVSIEPFEKRPSILYAVDGLLQEFWLSGNVILNKASRTYELDKMAMMQKGVFNHMPRAKSYNYQGIIPLFP